MTAAGATMAVNFIGANDVELVGLGADVTTVDASGMSTGGAVVQTGRAATAASTYTGSTGADTFMMLNTGDVLDGGAGSDTLNIDLTAILGGLGIDLSSTTDQVSTMNGGATSGTITNFENVDASGYTGFGAVITGSSVANTIIGTGSADQISTGGGADFITAGAGLDTLTGGAGVDNFILDTTAANADTITDFVSGTDVVDLSASLTAVTLTVNAQLAVGAAASTAAGITVVTTAANTDAEVYYIENTAGGTGALTLTQIETAITAGNTATGQVTVLIDNGTDTEIYIDQAAQTDAGGGAGMILVGTLSGVTGATAVATNDFVST
jgi:hypothetical protein